MSGAPFDIRVIDWPPDWTGWGQEPRFALACYQGASAVPIWCTSVAARFLYAYVGDGALWQKRSWG